MNLNQRIGNSDFRYAEFVKSDFAIRNNIHNIPNKFEIYSIENLVRYCLQPIRDYFGPIRVLSGFRCSRLNTALGGSKHSNHLFGYAADIEPIEHGVELIDVIEWIVKNLKYKELIAEYFPFGWIHIAYQENTFQTGLKLKNESYDYERMTIDDLKRIYH